MQLLALVMRTNIYNGKKIQKKTKIHNATQTDPANNSCEIQPENVSVNQSVTQSVSRPNLYSATAETRKLMQRF